MSPSWLKKQHGKSLLRSAGLHGADVDSSDTPFLRMIDTLLSHAVSLCIQQSWLCDDAIVRILQLLLDSELFMNCDGVQYTPSLLWAAVEGHLNVVQWLLSSEGGKTDAVKTLDKNGASCLHHAASGGHLNVMQWLLSSNGGNMQSLVNSSGTCPPGVTSLFFAIKNSHTAVFRCLREHGATIPLSHFKRICHVCMTSATSPTQLLCCAGCKAKKKKNELIPRYCSRTFQKIAWKTGHKIECQQE
jgi:ankyrin repeat protein